jgi:hypothetical protein
VSNESAEIVRMLNSAFDKAGAKNPRRRHERGQGGDEVQRVWCAVRGCGQAEDRSTRIGILKHVIAAGTVACNERSV